MNKVLLTALVLGGGYWLWKQTHGSPAAASQKPPVLPGLGTKTVTLKAGEVYRVRGNVTPKVVQEDVAGMAALIGARFGAIRSQIQQYAIVNNVEKDASLGWMDIPPAV